MNCREIARTMDAQIISASGLAKPTPELAEHFAGCPHCSERWDELHQIDKLIAQNVILLEPNPFLWTRLQSRLDDQIKEHRQAAGWFGLWINLFSDSPGLWAVRRQMVIGFCVLILVVSGVAINSQITNFQNSQMLAQIETQWNRLSVSPRTDNPFQLGLEEKGSNTKNPFPVLLEQKRDKNPFGAVKS